MKQKLIDALEQLLATMEKEWETNKEKYEEAKIPNSDDWGKAYWNAKNVLDEAKNNLTIAHK